MYKIFGVEELLAQQSDQEGRDAEDCKDNEQYLTDGGDARSKASEAEQRGNQRNDEEDGSVFQHDVSKERA